MPDGQPAPDSDAPSIAVDPKMAGVIKVGPGTDEVKFEIARDEVRHAYDLLSIVDGKASALLTFNAIALAALSIWLGYVPLNYMHLTLDLVFLVMLASCGLALTVVFLKWVDRDEPEDINGLEKLRRSRTTRYRWAWRLSVGGVGMLFLASAVHTVGTGLNATGQCGDICKIVFSERYLGNLDYREGD